VPLDIHFLTESALNDERLADYRNLKEQRLGEDHRRFVAESEMVVRKLLASPLRVCSVLLTTPRLTALESALAAAQNEFPIFVVPQAVMDGVAGFHVHRGCLAIAERPQNPTIPQHARLVVVAVDLVDVDNLGALVRNAAAFGADGILLSPRCADPFYRKAVRTSAGTVFSLPIVRARDWPADLRVLREAHGLSLVGAVLGDRAVSLAEFSPPPRAAILFGSEGPGLDQATQRLCDHLVTIPMAQAPGIDSLNVATAAAVFLYHVTQSATRPHATPRDGGPS
jgi:tRNA G18 (ribose-2'-O)-methylase SpoU